MALDPSRLLAFKIPPRAVRYSDRDTLLYGLALGAGNGDDIRLVHEDHQRVIPTFGQNLAFDDSWMEAAGVDISKVVHGGLDLSFEAPFAPSGEAQVIPSIVGVVDKGEGKAVILLQETRIHQSGRPIFTSLSSLFLRGAGGGGSAGDQPAVHKVPDRPADSIIEIATDRDQALLFRLLGDRNPLHALSGVAEAAGFERPIMHGACTFGIACLTVLQNFCSGDPVRMRRFAARFSGPLYPGETLVFSFWTLDSGVAFSAISKQRNLPVLDGGIAALLA